MYEDGVVLQRNVDRGKFPSVFYDKQDQDKLGTNWQIDYKSIDEGRAWWTKSDVIRDS